MLESNGINAPAYVFAIGDSLDGFYICKETKRYFVSYVIKDMDKEEKIAIKIVKKSGKWAKAMLQLCSYNQDSSDVAYITDDYKADPLTERSLAPPIVFLYYNNDRAFTGICVDSRLNKTIHKSQTDETQRSLAGWVPYLTSDENLKHKNDKNIIKLMKKVEKDEIRDDI